jgi:hypothetical protein
VVEGLPRELPDCSEPDPAACAREVASVSRVGRWAALAYLACRSGASPEAVATLGELLDALRPDLARVGGSAWYTERVGAIDRARAPGRGGGDAFCREVTSLVAGGLVR